MSERRRMLLAIVNQFKWLPYSYTYLYHSLVPTTIDSKNVRNKAKFTKIYGNSEVVNQLVATSDVRPLTTTTTNDITFTNNNDGSITISGTASADFYQRITIDIPISVQGHSWLIFSELLGDSSKYWLTDGWSGAVIDNGNAKIQTINTSYVVLRFSIKSGVQINQTIHPQLVDLTKQYPFDTPTTLTDNRVQNILAQGYIPYNTGEIKDMEIGNFSSEDSNNQPLGTLQLPAIYKASGIGTSKDSWEITNTSHIFTRNNFEVDLGSLVVASVNTTKKQIVISSFDSTPYVSTANDKANILSKDYYIATLNQMYNGYTSMDKAIAISTSGAKLWINDSGFTGTTTSEAQTYLTGKTLYYQLATPQVITIPRKHLAVVRFNDLSNWAYDSTRKFFATQISNIKVPTSQSELGNYYTSDFLNGTTNDIQGDTTKNMYFFITPSGYIGIRDLSCSTTNDFLAKHGNDVFFYETENEVADITDTFDIEAGGTITSDSEVLPDVDFKFKCK